MLRNWMRPILCLCSLMVLVACSTPEPNPNPNPNPNKKLEIPAEFTESATSVKFKTEQTAASSEKDMFLLGLGVRVNIIINVYAMGLYVEPVKAAEALAAWKGKEASALKEDDAFFEALLKGKFAKSMRLEMVFNVSGDQMAEAFEGSVMPRLTTEEGKTALQTFRGYFDVPMQDGEHIVFSWSEDGTTLYTNINGTKKEPIVNADLANALLAVYIDKEPISADAKKNFTNNLAMMFQRAEEKASTTP